MPRVDESIYDLLITQMSEDDMESRIKALIDDGTAKSRRSAANKLYREVREQVVGDETVEGLWLSLYIRRDETTSGYLLGQDGKVVRFTLGTDTPTPKIELAVGLAVRVGPATRMKNVFTGSEWLVTNPHTKVAKSKELAGATLTDYAMRIQDINDEGLYCVQGGIRFVNLVGVFEEAEGGQRELSHNLPLLEGDDVNLRLTIASVEGDGDDATEYWCTLKVKDRDVLAHLLDSPELGWLEDLGEEAALQEIQDMCMGLPVVAFGRGSKRLSNRRTGEVIELDRPFMDIGRGGFVQVVGE